MQATGKDVAYRMRKIGYGLLCFAAVILLAFLLPAAQQVSSYTDCERYTASLNGGLRKFKGKQYMVQLCGKADTGLGTEVRLQVLDEQGDIQARRYFTLHANSAVDRELSYSASAVLYYDHAKDEPLSMIVMPPTRWDWIRARIPLLN